MRRAALLPLIMVVLAACQIESTPVASPAPTRGGPPDRERHRHAIAHTQPQSHPEADARPGGCPTLHGRLAGRHQRSRAARAVARGHRSAGHHLTGRGCAAAGRPGACLHRRQRLVPGAGRRSRRSRVRRGLGCCRLRTGPLPGPGQLHRGREPVRGRASRTTHRANMAPCFCPRAQPSTFAGSRPRCDRMAVHSRSTCAPVRVIRFLPSARQWAVTLRRGISTASSSTSIPSCTATSS